MEETTPNKREKWFWSVFPLPFQDVSGDAQSRCTKRVEGAVTQAENQRAWEQVAMPTRGNLSREAAQKMEPARPGKRYFLSPEH